jgi:nucleotide-binding universal stress UspA family protein
MIRWSRLLVPFDDSAASRAALAEAIRIAQRTGAQLHLVHVMDELAWCTGFEPATVFFDDVVPAMRRIGEEMLGAACRTASASGVRADSRLVIGALDRVCEEVAREALHCGADIIVAGTAGRQGVDRLLIGSDAEQIVRHAPVPVLLVRSPPA